MLSANRGWCLFLGCYFVRSRLRPRWPSRRGPCSTYHLTHVDTREPFPSPDGKRVIFESNVAGYHQLFTMHPDGSDVLQITHDAWNHDTPSWSPDGRKFAFVSDQNKHSAVYVMNVDGSRAGTPVVAPRNAESIHPSWSPDNRQVIYCADDDLKPPKKNDASIYSVDVQSKVVKTLISGGVNTYPSWSPDGKQIAFRR